MKRFALILALLCGLSVHAQQSTLGSAPIGKTNSAILRGTTFPTITAAKNAAVSGDTVIVNPGTYSENNLLKRGVNYLGLPGANIVYVQTTTTDAGWGIFDDRTTGATTNIIDWHGDLVFISVTNVAAFATNDDNGAYFVGLNPNTLGLLVETNALSKLSVSARRIRGTSWQNTGKVIYAKDGLLFLDFDFIDDPTEGISYQDEFANSFSGASTSIFWGVGTVYAVGKHLRSTTSYSVLWTEPFNSTNVSDFHLTAQLIEGKLYGESFSSTYRMWVTADEIKGTEVNGSLAQPIQFAGNAGKFYITAQKIGGSMNAASIFSGLPNGSQYTNSDPLQVWITAGKVSAATNGTAWFTASGLGKWYFDVQQWEDPGGTVTAGISCSAGTTIQIKGGEARCAGAVLTHSGGSMRADGMLIQNTNQPPISVTGSGLKLKGCTIVSGSTNAINAASAQTVSVQSCLANMPERNTITLSPKAGWSVDAAAQ